MKNRIIVALDEVGSIRVLLSLAERLSPYVGGFKIGAHIDRYGVSAIRALKKFGIVMSDLKVYDIPSSAARRVKEHVDAGADFVTVNAAGGRNMLKACAYVAPTQLIAVTVLTSWNEVDTLRMFGRTMPQMVKWLARLASKNGAVGIVCAPRDLITVAEIQLPDLIKITPNVRPSWFPMNSDQNASRTMTPQDALLHGANYVVIGRPIISAQNPEHAAGRILQDIEQEFETPY